MPVKWHLLKQWKKPPLGFQIFHWRSKDGEEIDFLIQKNPTDFLFIEAKMSTTKPKDLKLFPEVRKIFGRQIPDFFICHQEGDRVFNSNIPIALLSDFLLKDKEPTS